MLITTFLLCNGLCVASLLAPGYVRPGSWRTAFVIITVGTAGMAVVALFQQLTPTVEAIVLYGTNIAIVVALAALTDREGARIGSLLLVLPTVFFALFLSGRTLWLQSVIVVVAAALVMWMGGDRTAVLALHTWMVIMASFVPAWSIRVVRRQLGVALARERDAAITDPLTGLANRRGLADRFEQALRAARRDEVATGLLLIDLDRFKEVNDTLGHDYGDHLLAQIGPRLTRALRDCDMVTRLGGDEFSVLLPTVDGVEAAVAVAERLRTALVEPFPLGGVDVEVEASIGVVVSGEHGEDTTTLLRHADVAMYVAKKQHIGVFVYDSDIDEHSPERLAVLGHLRRGLDRKELVLHYQPKVSLATGKVVGAEALVRWQHPDRGLVPPDEFIPLAESTGLIGPLTMYVLDAALAQARAFAAAGCAIPLAVNLSTRNLVEVGLCDQISTLLGKHAVPAERLELEVTESAIMTEPTRAKHLLTQLSELGIHIAIDDFGAGYTSLAQLKALPVTELKIDRSFVTDMDTNFSNALIAQSIIDLGHNLGLTIIAEGVETSRAMAILADHGCDVAQGYHLSRPLPPEAFLAWYAERTAAATSGHVASQTR